MSPALLEERLMAAVALYETVARDLQDVINDLERYGVPGIYLDQIQAVNYGIETGADLNRLLIARGRIKEMRAELEKSKINLPQ